MRKQFEFSEEDLYLAAREAEQFIRAQYPDAQTCPPHTFSPAFEADMQQLFAQLQTGTLKPSAARLGWPYYLRRSIAAILLCFLLACATMPEAVLAGYQKLIEVVENVLWECVEFYYDSISSDDEHFNQMKLKYLSSGMEEERKIKQRKSVDILYCDEEGHYFNIYQCLLSGKESVRYGIDTKGMSWKIVIIKGDEVRLVFEDDRIYFVWLSDTYYVSGQTNLSKEEVVKILSQIEF